jgi:hypothetical protein
LGHLRRALRYAQPKLSILCLRRLRHLQGGLHLRRRFLPSVAYTDTYGYLHANVDSYSHSYCYAYSYSYSYAYSHRDIYAYGYSYIYAYCHGYIYAYSYCNGHSYCYSNGYADSNPDATGTRGSDHSDRNDLFTVRERHRRDPPQPELQRQRREDQE